MPNLPPRCALVALCALFACDDAPLAPTPGGSADAGPLDTGSVPSDPDAGAPLRCADGTPLRFGGTAGPEVAQALLVFTVDRIDGSPLTDVAVRATRGVRSVVGRTGLDGCARLELPAEATEGTVVVHAFHPNGRSHASLVKARAQVTLLMRSVGASTSGVLRVEGRVLGLETIETPEDRVAVATVRAPTHGFREFPIAPGPWTVDGRPYDSHVAFLGAGIRDADRFAFRARREQIGHVVALGGAAAPGAARPTYLPTRFGYRMLDPVGPTTGASLEVDVALTHDLDTAVVFDVEEALRAALYPRRLVAGVVLETGEVVLLHDERLEPTATTIELAMPRLASPFEAYFGYVTDEDATYARNYAPLVRAASTLTLPAPPVWQAILRSDFGAARLALPGEWQGWVRVEFNDWMVDFVDAAEEVSFLPPIPPDGAMGLRGRAILARIDLIETAAQSPEIDFGPRTIGSLGRAFVFTEANATLE